MKWIKVEDRLPEVDVNVIALTSKGNVITSTSTTSHPSSIFIYYFPVLPFILLTLFANV